MACVGKECDYQGLIEQMKADWEDDLDDVKHLGNGDIGSVFYAWQKSRKGPVAIKMVNLRGHRGRAYGETVTLKLLKDHMHVVSMYTYKTVGDYMYILMEFCEGGSLCDYLTTHGVMSEKAASHIIRQVYSAVRLMHSRKIIHMDLTTRNVLIKDARDPNSIAVRLCDFGLVSDVNKGSLAETSGIMKRVASNNLKYYLRGDLYSMGCLLYSMLVQKDLSRSTREGVIDDMVQEVNKSSIKNEVKDLIKSLLNREFKDIEDLRFCEFMGGNDSLAKLRPTDQVISITVAFLHVYLFRKHLESEPTIAWSVSAHSKDAAPTASQKIAAKIQPNERTEMKTLSKERHDAVRIQKAVARSPPGAPQNSHSGRVLFSSKVVIHSDGTTRSYTSYSSLKGGDRTLYQDAIARINEYIDANASLKKHCIAKINNLRHFTEESCFCMMVNGSCRLHLSKGEKIIRSSTGEYKMIDGDRNQKIIDPSDRIRRVMDFHENQALINWLIKHKEQDQIVLDDSQDFFVAW
ncbi:hypothetical protein QR680_004350 [Steinernema hermaphroditum]|uniref:Protein kinase domain-containing protein n=1 Tax=Steinernema hermaphroditum TaxID=289476 RepID=A0AA39HNE7_9BILA|nr:hypothetical protein QR680_004350 [Steinernema hermaphroditum]